MRSQAYLATHEGSKAAGELQKIFEHRGITLNPIGALAHLGLARAYVFKAKLLKPRRRIRIFLRCGKTPIPDMPVLKEANAEYTKLH